MRLGQRELSIIQTVLQLKTRVVKLNKTWTMLNKDMQIGSIIKRELHLSESDLDVLRVLYGKHVKTEPEVTYDSNADRISLADHRIDEKSGNASVFGEQLWFAAINAQLPLKSGEMHIAHPGVTTAVSLEHLAVEKIRKLIIIENGTMLVRISDWYQQVPLEWQDSLFLYRGHGKNCRSVNQLLEVLPEECPVAVYTDFDLYGLNIANNFNLIRPVSVMVPQCWQSIKEQHPDNNFYKYVDQSEYISDLSETEGMSEPMKAILKHVNFNKVAVMQENVNRLGPLVCLAI